MAEYTLKLKVDASELAQQLRMLSGGGGGQPGVLGMGSVSGGGAQILQLREMKKQTEQYKQGIMGKFGPSLVKLAGFSMGLAGILQFRKMLIDSSPILQAMLKIVNTAFTLVLRPLGDFLGLFFMPMAIGMLHFAVPFYKAVLPLYPDFLRAGTKFFEGDLGGAIDILFENLEAIGGRGATGGAITGGLIGGQVGTILGYLFGDNFLKWWENQKRNTPFGFGGAQTAAAASGRNSAIQQAKNVVQAIKDIFPWLRTGGTIDVSSGDPGTGVRILDELKVEHTRAKVIAREIAITEQLKLDQTNISLEHVEGAVCGFENIEDIINQIATGQMKGIDDASLDMLRHIRNAKISGLNMSVSMLDTANAFRVTYDTVLRILQSFADLRLASGRRAFPGAAGNLPGGGGGGGGGSVVAKPTFQSFDNARATLQGAWGYNDARGEFAYQNLNPHLFGPAGMTSTTDVLNIWRNFSDAQITGLRNQGAIKFAKGGILREPVFGIGASGQSYQFGEKGPETISPVGQSGGGGNLYISVSGIRDVTEFESKLRPMVMRWLKEAKSNRGIL